MAELQQAPEEEKRGRGRPPANGTCIMWTEAMVETLLQLRFKTYMSELSVARGSKSLKQAWASLAEELSCQNNVVVSVEQCRNKIKALKSKWLAYHAGGMSAEPVCLALMDTFWEAPTPASPSIAIPNLVSPTQLLDVGMQALSQGFTDIASAAIEAARPKSAGSADNEEFSRLEKVVNDRFAEVLGRQDKQLQLIEVQNQLLAQVVAELQRGQQIRNDLLG
ncbi:hypothetical protein BBO99_00007360 [Phytophthora kernoviae]|uniref:Myb/SANT-like DNA-binding domain-containing protein n=1 Tax=Phytophthora kernoviae TaxID=325452 RepID=A0A3R7HFB9_9STRA|nr:hypothetical protein JM18_006858 [Phytophthora kernoviae]RLN21029.1 hypothetical protein BBI17_007315 [Phytophthora kernoviae]RLN76671.1 hypothetical protein BBO99_00007360 [Phytophthora kernoviae]